MPTTCALPPEFVKLAPTAGTQLFKYPIQCHLLCNVTTENSGGIEKTFPKTSKCHENNIQPCCFFVSHTLTTELSVLLNSTAYLLSLIHIYFTKWVEVYAIPNQEVTTVAKELVHNFCCRYGAPMEIHTDQGRNFKSGVFKELCRLLGIRKTRTTPLHPQLDGMVEKFQ